MTINLICRAITGGNSVKYETQIIKNGKIINTIKEEKISNLKKIIENDKRYGLLKPKNGKSYGYFIINKDNELTKKQTRKGVTRALFRWWLDVKIEFHRVQNIEDADLKIYFRDEKKDEILTPSTLAYMYYPLGGSVNGTCVVNRRFWWTLSGEGVDLHLQDPVNYPTPTGKKQGGSHDLDQVLGHEFGHGIFGLPHSTGMMYPNYGKMTEFLTLEDVKRASAKVGRRNMVSRKYKRLQAWLNYASDRE